MRYPIPLLLLSAVLPACKPLADAPVFPDATIAAEVHFLHHGVPFQPGDTLRDATGRLVALDRIRFQVGALWLQDDLHQVLAEFPANRWDVRSDAADRSYPIGRMAAAHLHVLALAIRAPVPHDQATGLPTLELTLRVAPSGTDAVPQDIPFTILEVPWGADPFHAQVDAHVDPLPGELHTLGIRVRTERLLASTDVSGADTLLIQTLLLDLVSAMQAY